MSETVEIEVEKLKMLFDLVVQSMDFGSGFLDHEDVTLLRETAGIIGADPMEATPSEFRKRIQHPYREPNGNPYISATTGVPALRPCYWCGKKPSDSVHLAESASAGTDPADHQPSTEQGTT
jgi:hypothetical protein